MPATADQIKSARSYIGSTETDAVFNERYDRLGPGEPAHVKLSLAVVESIRAQLAALIFDQPTQITVGGDSFSWAANIRALEHALATFPGFPDPESDLGGYGTRVGVLYRRDLR